MAVQLEETLVPDAEPRRRTMKFTFPPEAQPLDGYTIKRGIHRGGFGEVYYALSDAGKEVALKLVNHNMEVELRGVRQCLNLKHPNLVSIFDIRTDKDGDHWIVMEYVAGRTLDRALDAADGSFSPAETLQWLDGMAEGLAFMHDRGIVHRDLKPANIYREAGVVKIGDVGLAKFISQSRRSAQTESVGTVYYMAPEIARGRYAREVDIYSLGVVLYEMLTGRVPFDGESTAEILMKHLSEQPDLSPVPKKLRPVLAAALEKDPMKRTANVEKLRDDFRRALNGEAIPRDIPDESFHAVGAELAAATGEVESAVSELEAAQARVKQELDAYRTLASNPTKKGRWKRALLERRKSLRHARIEERKALRHARIEERKAARHARHQERKGALHRRKMEKKLADRVDSAARTAAVALDPTPPTAPVPVAVKNETPLANQPVAVPAQKDKRTDWLKGLAVVIILLAIVAPRSLPPLVGGVIKLVFLCTIGFLIYAVCKALGGAKCATATATAATSASKPPPVPAVAPVVVATPKREKKKPAKRHVTSILSPETPRPISLRARMAELTGSLAFAALFSAVIAGVVTVVMYNTLHDPGKIALFGSALLLGSWAVVAVSKLFEGTETSSASRRMTTAVVAAGVGAALFFIGQLLFVQFGTNDFLGMGPPHDSSRSLGALSLLEGGQPTLAEFMLFFGGLFAIRHWWRHADSFRRKRLSVGSVLLTTAAGWVWSLILGFPLLWGVMLAAGTSCVVQLAAVYAPYGERRRMQEVPADV